MADHFLTYQNITIKSPYPIQQISSLEITGSFNDHGRLQLTGILEEENAGDVMTQSWATDEIEVY